MSITFDDALQTKCDVVMSSETELACETQPFDKIASNSQTHSINIVINGASPAGTFQVKMVDYAMAATTLQPSSASPVLKTKLSIVIDPRFTETLAVADFSVNATSRKNSTYIRYLNVLEAHQVNKTIVVMFGGAYTGIYDVVIRHKRYGRLETGSLVLTVESKVTSISPSVGSIYGGTLITIKGTNFGS